MLFSFFNDTATTEIYTLSLHDALPICLLENGANTSFVHALLDEKVPAARVVEDPITKVESRPGPHPCIPTPENIYGDRRNTPGIHPASVPERDSLVAAVRALDGERLTAGPIVNGDRKS